MAFEVRDYMDLVNLLNTHPEWRAELRRLLLTDELLQLPAVVRELAEAQRRTEERVEELAEAQRRTEERVEELAEAQRQLAEAQQQLAAAQQRTEERIARVEEQMVKMVEAQHQMAQTVQALAEDQRRLTDTVSSLKGTVLEWRYRDRAHAYFGDLLRRLQVVPIQSLEETLEARLSEEAVRDLFRLDLLVCGRPRHIPSAPEVYLAVEVSAVVDRRDVQRATRRARALREAGYFTIPVVAGEVLTQGAEDEAKEHRVVIMKDGKVDLWNEAWENWSRRRPGDRLDNLP